MRQLLSLILCICLLVDTIVPSFAQSLPVVAGKEGIMRLFSAGLKDAALTRALFEDMILAGIENGVYQETSAAVSTIHQHFETGNLEGISREILELPDLAIRDQMLRNEMLVLALNDAVPAAALEETLTVFHRNLEKAPAIFEQIPASQTLTSFVQNAVAAQKNAPAQQVLGVLADASALALVGTSKDLPSLLRFYEASEGTIFEDIAGVIVARGCLRFGEYEALNDFMANHKSSGLFWSGLAQYAKENNLPLNVPFMPLRTEETIRAANHVSAYLNQGGPLLAIQGDFSSKATSAWVSLGKTTVPLTRKTQGPVAPTARKIVFSSSQPNPPLQDPQPTIESVPADEVSVVEQPVSAREPIVPAGIQVTIPLLSLTPVQPETSILPPLKAAANPVAAEITEPEGLHENNVRELYEEVQLPPAEQAEDYVSAEALPALIPIAGEGFKFTLERGGTETILDNVDISISAAIKLASGYNRLVHTGTVFQLRNQNLDPKNMEHFFFALSTKNGELQTLIEGAQTLRSSYPLRIKIKRENSEDSFLTKLVNPFKKLASGKTVVQIPIYNGSKEGSFILADLDVSLLPAHLTKSPEQGYLVVNGKRITFYSPEGQTATLSQFYVRLPKEESSKWVRILQNHPQTHFKLNVYPTENKTAFMTYVISLLRVGTGKIFGPIMKFLGIPDWASTAIPLFANNGMSLLLGPLMPVLRRIGEANMYRLGVALYAASSVTALSLGFNGFLGIENATIGQLGGFIGVLFGMGIAGTLVNTVNNNLLASNAGRITVPRKKGGKKAVVTRDEAPTVSFLGKRMKEIFTTKNVEMRNSVIYQLASAMKNVTTFLFASWPFLFNLASEAVGSSVRADFSLSFWFLAGVSLYSLVRILNMPLKDSFPRNMAVLQKMATEKEVQVGADLEKQLRENPQVTPDYAKMAQQLNSILGPYARQTSYVMKENTKEVSAQLEKETVASIKEALLKAGIEQSMAEKAAQGLQEAFGALGRRNANMRDVLKKPLVFSSLLAMTLLTVHELGTSSEFAFAVNDALKAGGMDPKASIALGTFLSALFLYAPSFFFRLAGNWFALRMSEGSMYAFSSACSVLGTALMIASGGSLPMLFSGAIFATFGMGNFFSQIYEYIMSLQPKHKTELAVLVGYTMPIAAGLTAGIRSLASWGLDHGIYGLGLMICQAALIGSFFAVPGMFAGSSLVQSAKYYIQKMMNFFKRGGTNNPMNTDPAPLPADN